MSDLLGIGASGVRAYQTALTVVGSNISNASTTGYVRRDVQLSESLVSSAGGVANLTRSGGGGVDVGAVTRAWDQFKAADVRTASSDVASSDTSVTYLTRIQGALSSGGTSAALTTFFDSAQALAADPTSIADRTQLLSDAGSVAQAFQGTAASLADVKGDILTDAQTSVDTLNGLSANLAQLNSAIASAKGGTTQQAALFDQRDQFIDQIGSLAAVSVDYGADGTATVRLNGATGPTLVSGVNASRLDVSGSATGTLAFTLRTGNTDPQAVSVAGGALAGLVDSATQAANASATLDTLANGFAQAVNGVQGDGVDLDGHAGGAMFTTGYATATPMAGTSGAASIQVTLAANATPAAGGYAAVWDAGNSQWTLSRADGSAQVAGTGTLSLDGVSVALGGAPAAGDGYTIATGSGAAGLSTTSLSARGVAAASPWTVDTPSSNAGTGAVTASTSGTPAASTFQVSYSAGTVTIADPASGTVLGTAAFVAGQAVTAGGVTFTLTGQPEDGDSFTVAPTGTGSRSNANLANLTAIRQSGDYETRADTLLNQTATTLAAKQALASAQGAIRDNAVAARDDASGVNLDQEAVDLLKFQQAYQASSKVIQTARDTFQSILNIN